MAGPLLLDRVLETTTTTGTGTLTLAGAVAGYQAFSVVGNTNTCYACIYEVDADGVPSGAWEVFLGTYTASGTTLSRDTVLSSSTGSAISFGAGTKRVALVLPAARAGGVIVDCVYAEYTAATGLTVAVPLDNTIPQQTEGTEVLTAAITPKSATNRIRVRFQCFASCQAAKFAIAALFVDASANALAAMQTYISAGTTGAVMTLEYEESAASTSARTYKVRAGTQDTTALYINGYSAAPIFGGTPRATLIVEEIAPL